MFKKAQKGYQQRMADQDANRQVPQEELAQVLQDLERVTAQVRERVQPPDRVEELKKDILSSHEKGLDEIRINRKIERAEIEQLRQDIAEYQDETSTNMIVLIGIFLVLMLYITVCFDRLRRTLRCELKKVQTVHVHTLPTHNHDNSNEAESALP